MAEGGTEDGSHGESQFAPRRFCRSRSTPHSSPLRQSSDVPTASAPQLALGPSASSGSPSGKPPQHGCPSESQPPQAADGLLHQSSPRTARAQPGLSQLAKVKQLLWSVSPTPSSLTRVTTWLSCSSCPTSLPNQGSQNNGSCQLPLFSMFTCGGTDWLSLGQRQGQIPKLLTEAMPWQTQARTPHPPIPKPCQTSPTPTKPTVKSWGFGGKKNITGIKKINRTIKPWLLASLKKNCAES